MSKRLLLIAALFITSWGSAAQAKWYVAESDHFVVYADDSEKDVRRFSQMLESYHAAMEFVTGQKVAKPSPSSRLTIYAVGSQRDVRKLYGENNRYVGGFYVPRASGSIAIVPDIRMTSGEPTQSMIILLHEYAHHFMISSSRFAMPRWLSEGSAEFFASAKFPRNGEVIVGRPAYHRAGELTYAKDVSIRALLDQDLYQKNRSKGYDALYGRSWLLYHYLTFQQERRGQMGTYARALLEGKSALDAAESAFGDLDQLDKDLDRYFRSRRMYTFAIDPERLQTGPITTGEVSEGHGEILPLQIESKRGVTREQAIELLKEVRKVAAQYPDDPAVLAVLAEAEHDAGNYRLSIDAADKAIAANPKTKNAYVQKGYAMFELARNAQDKAAAYRAAMQPFSALNKLENDHPLPLIYYYRSYAERGADAPEQAKKALERAAQLAPFDEGLWMNVAVMEAQEGKLGLAKYNLTPLANNPHGGSLAATAQAMIAALDGAKKGEPLDLSFIQNIPVGITADGDDDGDDEGDDEGGEERVVG